MALWRVAASSPTLQITYVDVGQGDAALLQGSDGFNILVDGGDDFAGPTVVAYLDQNGVDKIDVLVASHNDSDHIGGLIDVLEDNSINVNAVYFNGYPATSLTFQNFAAAVANEGLTLTPLQYPQELMWGAMEIYILNPPPGLAEPDQNDASVVLLVKHGNQKFLFTGDISQAVEAQILARQTPIAAQVLKVAHHGSDTSSSQAFIDSVDPLEAVISVGINPFDHPSDQVVDRLADSGARIWRTDWNGHIWVTSDSSSYTITSQITDFLFLPQTQREFNAAYNDMILIQSIFADGAGSKEPDEYVELRNDQANPISLAGWTLRDEDAHVYTFPDLVMDVGQICRIYTNEYHPEWCGLNWASPNPIWDNSGECAVLRNEANTLIDSHCY
jgi:beta-lactamase superfamily II metal-dependent hydrolase